MLALLMVLGATAAEAQRTLSPKSPVLQTPAAQTPPQQTPGQESRILAVVNSDIVTGDDLSARMALIMRSSEIPDTPENRQRLAPRLLRQLIDEKLQMQEAHRLNVTVSETEINTAVANIEQRNNMQKGALDEYFKKLGIPRSTLTDQLTASLAWNKVIRSELLREVSVSQEEINEAMARIKDDAGKPQSHVDEIFLAMDNPTQEDDIRRLAERLIEQIRAGANFSSVAQQFSQSSSAAAGGDIGWVTPNQLGPPMGEALEKMKPGEMSYPLRTPAGFYILYVTERRTPGVSDVNDTQLTMVQVGFPLTPASSAADRQRAMAEAQAMSNEAKSCGELTKLGNDHVPKLQVQNGSVKAGTLPAEVRPQILALKIAEASKPLSLGGNISVVMVCDRKDPGGGLPSREEVQENLARERLDALSRRYLRDLRRAAYVDVRG
jgi:peptidyl-prolyl cis-trans isomerase SurA